MLINTLLSLLRGYHVDLGTVAAQVISILFVILCILPLHELAMPGWRTSWGIPPPSWRGGLPSIPWPVWTLWRPGTAAFRFWLG